MLDVLITVFSVVAVAKISEWQSIVQDLSCINDRVCTVSTNNHFSDYSLLLLSNLLSKDLYV